MSGCILFVHRTADRLSCVHMNTPIHISFSAWEVFFVTSDRQHFHPRGIIIFLSLYCRYNLCVCVCQKWGRQMQRSICLFDCFEDRQQILLCKKARLPCLRRRQVKVKTITINERYSTALSYSPHLKDDGQLKLNA